MLRDGLRLTVCIEVNLLASGAGLLLSASNWLLGVVYCGEIRQLLLV